MTKLKEIIFINFNETQNQFSNPSNFFPDNISPFQQITETTHKNLLKDHNQINLLADQLDILQRKSLENELL